MSQTVFDRVYGVAFVLSAGVLFFTGGMLVAEYKVPPFYPFMSQATLALDAYLVRRHQTQSPFHTDLWVEPRRAETGVTVYEKGRAFEGFTLFTSGHASKAFLIDMDGRVAQEWHLPFYQAWPRPTHIKHPVPEDFICWRKAHLFPNGDLLAIYIGAGDTPWGYGLVKVDKESHVIWTYDACVHHDLSVDDRGRIYVLVHRINPEPVPGYPALPHPFIDDDVVVLSAAGEPLQTLNLLTAFRNSPFAHLLNLAVTDARGDLFHPNAVKVLNRTQAAALPFAEEGYLLLSLRELSALAVMDPKQETIVWAGLGPWKGQHDPDVLDDGTILLFDNLGAAGAAGSSRVMEVRPLSKEVPWTYAGTREQPLASRLRSAQQRLPNGNTLITESDGARILEVDRQGTVVWEWCSPFRKSTDRDWVGVVMHAARFPRSELVFLSLPNESIAEQTKR